jgi:hypothetical protein
MATPFPDWDTPTKPNLRGGLGRWSNWPFVAPKLGARWSWIAELWFGFSIYMLSQFSIGQIFLMKPLQNIISECPLHLYTLILLACLPPSPAGCSQKSLSTTNAQSPAQMTIQPQRTDGAFEKSKPTKPRMQGGRHMTPPSPSRLMLE